MGARCRSDVAATETNPAYSSQIAESRHHSTRLDKPLRAHRAVGFTPSGRHSYLQHNDAPFIANRASVCLLSTARSCDRSLPLGDVATRRGARSHLVLALRLIPRVAPGGSTRGPTQVRVHPANRTVVHRIVLSGSFTLRHRNGKGVPHKTVACLGVRRCCHRRRFPGGQSASQQEQPQTTTCHSVGQMPSAELGSVRPRSTPPRGGANPPIVRPSMARLEPRASSASLRKSNRTGVSCGPPRPPRRLATTRVAPHRSGIEGCPDVGP